MAGIVFWLCVLFVFYTYAGYPVLIVALSRLRPRPRWPEPDSWPDLTLLIAAYNEESVIEARLENALSLDYPRDRLQILVATDGSDDRTVEIVKSFADRGVELSHHPERGGKMSAINNAMERARGDIVVFSDANNHYAADCLRHLVAPFADPRVGAVSGAKQITDDGGGLSAMERIYWRYESTIKDAETRLGSCVAAAGEILSIRRDLFDRPPRYVITDDFYMIMRVLKRGYRVVSSQTAMSIEKASPSQGDENERRARNNAGRFQSMAMTPRLLSWRRPVVAWQVFSHKFFRPLVAPAFLFAFLLSIVAVICPASSGSWGILRLAAPWNWIVFIPQAVFWALALAGPLFKGRSRLLSLPAYLLNANYAALMGMWRFLRGGQSVLWQKVPRS